MTQKTIKIFLLGVLFVNSQVFAQANNPNHLFFQDRDFDLQAHRGGIGLTVESTIASFSKALEVGVTTLELDTQITKDGVAVVTHDRLISDKKCQDTQAVTPVDTQYPYVGKYIKDLTLAQVKTLDCGSMRLTDFPNQALSPNATMPTLTEIFDLVKSYNAYNVLLNIETKVEAGAPEETASQELFVDTVLADIAKSGLTNQVTIQSFDWGALMLVREKAPGIPIVALTNGEQFLQTGQAGASPWLGGLDIDDFSGLVEAAASFGADAISPVHGSPQNGVVGDKDYDLYTTKEMVDQAHAVKMKVIPWSIDDPATMQLLIDQGVDGMITNYPDRLRSVMLANSFAMPPQLKLSLVAIPSVNLSGLLAIFAVLLATVILILRRKTKF